MRYHAPSAIQSRRSQSADRVAYPPVTGGCDRFAQKPAQQRNGHLGLYPLTGTIAMSVVAPPALPNCWASSGKSSIFPGKQAVSQSHGLLGIVANPITERLQGFIESTLNCIRCMDCMDCIRGGCGATMQ